jgi:hypothetical protein
MTEIIKGVFELDGPMYDLEGSPLYNCALCDGAFEVKDGHGVAWVTHGLACCSELCAKMYHPDNDPRLRSDQ